MKRVSFSRVTTHLRGSSLKVLTSVLPALSQAVLSQDSSPSLKWRAQVLSAAVSAVDWREITAPSFEWNQMTHRRRDGVRLMNKGIELLLLPPFGG